MRLAVGLGRGLGLRLRVRVRIEGCEARVGRGGGVCRVEAQEELPQAGRRGGEGAWLGLGLGSGSGSGGGLG